MVLYDLFVKELVAKVFIKSDRRELVSLAPLIKQFTNPCLTGQCNREQLDFKGVLKGSL